MRLLDSLKTSQKLIELIEAHKNTAFAVAWASYDNKVFEKLRNSRSKIRYGIIGTHFNQTDWRVLKWTVDQESNVQFIFDEKANSVFHPKIYVFWTKEKWDVVIGSANLTVGGMKNNTELTVHLSGSNNKNKNTNIQAQAIEEIRQYWKDSVPINQNRLKKYKKQFLESRKKSSRTRHNIESTNGDWDWDEYRENILHSAISIESVKRRIELLSMARESFDGRIPFDRLPDGDRKALAGTYRSKTGKWAEVDIGYFGFTGAYGHFAHAVKFNNAVLSDAIGQIPITGPVYRAHYMNYVDLFKTAFQGKRHGLGVAARLLTVKRPDTFITWNKGNKQCLKNLLGLRPMVEPTTDYERYWDEVIVAINESDWYQSNEPASRKRTKGIAELDLWQNRVAMEDVLCWD